VLYNMLFLIFIADCTGMDVVNADLVSCSVTLKDGGFLSC
jgi:hypothetical protein